MLILIAEQAKKLGFLFADMENSDMKPFISPSLRRGSPWVPWLAESLWGPPGPQGRSRDLTVLYVQRYVGPLTSRVSTRHEWWELLCVTSGRGALHGQWGRPLPLETDDAVLLPPRAAHYEEAETALGVIWIGLAGSRLRNLPRREPLCLHSPLLRERSEDIWRRSQERGTVGPELDGLGLALVGALQRIRQDPPPKEDRILWAVEHIRSHFSHDLPMSDLAEACRCSEGHFYRSFRSRMGVTPLAFLQELRLSHAVKLLRFSDLKIEDIAAQAGYHDALYFSRLFHRAMGQSPSSFRASLR
jgi:AraC-like DNA-binding protein